MHEKLDYYDVLGHVVPGLVLVGGVWLLADWLGRRPTFPRLPDAILVLVVLALSILAGQIVQALSSIMEPFYYWTWRGMPSDLILAGKRGRFSPKYLELVKSRLQYKMLGENSAVPVTDRDLFLFSLALCNRSTLGRANRFNSLYAYHRALTTLAFLFLLVTLVAVAFANPSPAGKKWVVGGEFLVMLLLWYRTRKRGEYFAEEVIRMAEFEVTDPKQKKQGTKEDN